jgi:hypothetical protein
MNSSRSPVATWNELLQAEAEHMIESVMARLQAVMNAHRGEFSEKG